MTTTDSKFTGAGFVIISHDSSQLLALIKNNGVFDIPKGHANIGEVPLQTAIRECWEECAIRISNEDIISQIPYINDGLYIYTARSNKRPQIIPNPETGELEHVGYMWVTPDGFSKNAPKYLTSVIENIFNDIM